jgi:hypothetical protein
MLYVDIYFDTEGERVGRWTLFLTDVVAQIQKAIDEDQKGTYASKDSEPGIDIRVGWTDGRLEL